MTWDIHSRKYGYDISFTFVITGSADITSDLQLSQQVFWLSPQSKSFQHRKYRYTLLLQPFTKGHTAITSFSQLSQQVI